ncbi:MAG: rod shape-determining protein MreC [Sphingobacteriales bacterium]|jgi:rod shape-determining protein MreC
MRSLWLFLAKYYTFILFLILEVIAIAMLVNGNFYQQTTFYNSTNNFAGGVYERSNRVNDFFSLSSENERLHAENAALINRLKQSARSISLDTVQVVDTIYEQQYKYIKADIINKSTIKRSNYFTLNRGYDAGIRKNMGVICEDGVVGIIKAVSPRFSSGHLLLHKDVKISALIEGKDSFGSLIWKGPSARYAILKDIPLQVKVAIGDKISTSGFSTIFPKGIPIGEVESLETSEGDNLQTIKVVLSTNFNIINHVYVVEDFFLEEKITVENLGKR